MNKFLGYVEYGDSYHLKELLKESLEKNGIDTEQYNADSIWENASLNVSNDGSDKAKVKVIGNDFIIVERVKLNELVQRINNETKFTAIPSTVGLFIECAPDDFQNDYSLTIEDGEIRVAYTGSTEYFDNIEEAGDYLIKQLNFSE